MNQDELSRAMYKLSLAREALTQFADEISSPAENRLADAIQELGNSVGIILDALREEDNG